MLSEVPKTDPLPVASLYELLQRQPLDEMSSEVWLERGINEKMQKQFPLATIQVKMAQRKN